MKDLLEKLTALVQTFLPEENIWQTPVADLMLYRVDCPQEQVSFLQEPSICLILQGEKSVKLGEHHYHYGNGQFACYSVDLPVIGDVKTGSKARPNLGIKLSLNCEILLPLMQEMRFSCDPQTDCGVLSIGELSKPLAEAFTRLVSLLNTPEDITVLAPMVQREIYYRLLMSEQGYRLRQIIKENGHLLQITKAINWLKTHFAEPLNIDELTAMSGMSVSGFYHHFQRLTTISPLQYQKQLRLIEAQRQIKTKGLNTTLAAIAHQVGYESASQFSREYKRFFGVAPSKD